MVKIHGLDAGQPKPMRSTFLPAFRNNVSCAIVTAGIWIPYEKKMQYYKFDSFFYKLHK